MAWMSTLNPVPGFPEYSGPYKVGSFDVELPVEQLKSASPAPDRAVSTVAYRVFYPCEPGAPDRPVRWVPSPQKGYMSSYARFLGISSLFAQIFAYFPQLLYYTSIPVHRNAHLLKPNTKNARWPVMIFSHGLGGSRNAYSHICGSISSHGMVVIAPEHRDGSGPISYVRATEKSEKTTVGYINLPHKPSKEVWEARDGQLKIRLWELGLVHDAVLKMDSGEPLTNLDENKPKNSKQDTSFLMSMLKDKLDVHRPGSVAWAGHSFGAASVHQLVKSVFYRTDEKVDGYHPLYTPGSSSSIAKQITSSSPLILLDMWCLPLMSPKTEWLGNKPLPCYTPDGPGGTALLAILSESFVKWTEHFVETKKRLSEDPTGATVKHDKAAPRFFYPLGSAHLSQSDFGILFNWMTKRLLKTEDPIRLLKLNVRATMQVLRENGFDVAETSRIDMEEAEAENEKNDEQLVAATDKSGDWKILGTNGAVKGWIALTTDPDTGKPKPLERTLSDTVVEGEALGEVTFKRDMQV